MNTVIKLSSASPRTFWEIPVLFEDAHLLVLDKPSGLRLSPDREHPDAPALMPLLHGAIAAGKPWVAERGLTYLCQAHRLDAETSGVLISPNPRPDSLRWPISLGMRSRSSTV